MGDNLPNFLAASAFPERLINFQRIKTNFEIKSNLNESNIYGTLETCSWYGRASEG